MSAPTASAPWTKKMAYDIGMMYGVLGFHIAIVYAVVTGSGWLFLFLIPSFVLTSWGGHDKHGNEYDYASDNWVD